MNKLTKICYFSGTGNTLWSAQKIANSIDGDCTLVNIGKEIFKNEINLEADAVILVFPAYAYGAPVIIRRFAKKAIIKAAYLALFVTYGTSPGGALAEIGRILSKRKIKVSWFGRLPSVENYIALFGPQSEKTITRRLDMQTKTTDAAIRVIKERQTNSINMIRPFSAFVSLLFSLGVKIFYKRYKVSDECNGCGICEKVCPVSAVTMRDGKPVFSGKCEHCQGCINWCPQRAIHFGKVGSQTPRYHHPEISVSDISR